MTFVPLPEIAIENAAPDLANALALINNMGAVCTMQTELEKFAIVCMIVGMVVGAICVLVYQGTQRKLKKIIAEKNAQMRKEQDFEE